MLSFNIPTLTETIALSGVDFVVFPLPLFFRTRVQKIFGSPPRTDGDETSIERTLYLLRLESIFIVEALHEAGNIKYGDDKKGRPAWDDPSAWPIYAATCMDALTMAGITGNHVKAIQNAYGRLEDQSMKGLDDVGNS